MPSRVDKYEKKSTQNKRVSKNQELYQDLKNYTNYKEVSRIEPVIEKETFDLEDLTDERKKKAPVRKTIETEKISSFYDG